jgi:uncharacterized Zn finger protein
MTAVDDAKKALETSSNQTVRLPGVELGHADRVQLALEHDIHSVWDLVTGQWAVSKGVPQEVVLGYQAESDTPMTSETAAHPIATEPDAGIENPPVKAAEVAVTEPEPAAGA